VLPPRDEKALYETKRKPPTEIVGEFKRSHRQSIPHPTQHSTQSLRIILPNREFLESYTQKGDGDMAMDFGKYRRIVGGECELRLGDIQARP